MGLGTARLWLSSLFSRETQDPPIRRILVLGYAAIGDLIFFLPVLEGLRRHYPEAKIVFVANEYATTKELLPAAGVTDEIWLADWEGKDISVEQKAITQRIRGHGFDLAVLSLSSPAHFFQEALQGIPLRAGHLRVLDTPHSWGLFRHALWKLKRSLVTGELARRVLINRPAWVSQEPEHALVRNLRILDALGIPYQGLPRPRIPISTKHQSAARKALEGQNAAKKRIGVHLGPPKSLYGKMWAPERFGELCARLAREWPVEFVVVGVNEERVALKAAVKAAGRDLDSFVGGRPLLATFALIERCDLFLCNDTGLAKAAMAMGVPTATLWGPVDPAEFGIIWEPEKHLDIRTGIACSPCARMGMPNEGVLNFQTCGHHDCLRGLEVERVFAAIKEKFGPLFSAS